MDPAPVPRSPPSPRPLSFQGRILQLPQFWCDQGCAIL
ncbi:MAG: glycine--tRNA ligase subunit alpha, partial [Komagataeibacter saccharivorans]